MAPKAAANAAPVVRQDLPWALSVLGNPDADPTQLPLALNFLVSFNLAQLPQDVDVVVQLVTLATPFMCATDPNVTAIAIKLISRLVSEARGTLQEALRKPASLQALWAVVAYFHASFDAYAARLVVINSEPVEAVVQIRKPDSRLAKGPPPPPVDPESTLPGPSKFALDAAIAALTLTVGSSVEAEDAAAEVIERDVVPLMTLLRHHSCRIQVMSLRMMRVMIRSERLAIALTAAGAVAQLSELLTSSPFGAVREEILVTLSRLMAACAAAMQLALESGLLASLLKHLLAPTTGVPLEPPEPFSEPMVALEGDEAPPEPPPGPPPIDVTRPVASSPDKLQELSAQILLQLAKHHHGTCQELLRLGATQLLLGLLPAPVLAELPPEPKKRASSASETFFASILGRARTSTAGPPPPPTPKDAWIPFLDGPPTLPLPTSPLTSHPLQASLLTTLSCLLAEPGVQDYWWSVHASKRWHLHLMYLLMAAPLPKQEPVTPSRRTSTAGSPDPTKPPFPPEVRSAALQCVLQLLKHPQWLQVAPFLTAMQQTVRESDAWAPGIAAPLAEILQRIMQTRLPPPPRAAAAAAAAASSSLDGAPLVTLTPLPNVTPNSLTAEENGLSDAELSSEEIVDALKALAKMAREGKDPWTTSVVAAALLVLPNSATYAAPWPPLPSPPPTPPPPPLPTSQYLWDALGRPVMTDGIKLVHL